MTSSTADDVTNSRQNDRELPLLGLAAVAVAGIGLAFANFQVEDGENGGASDFAFMLLVSIGLAAALFGYVLPRVRPEGPAKFWLAGLAVLSALPAFWTGVPMVLGVAAVAAGRRAGSTLVMALGGLAALVAVVSCIVG